MKDSLIKQMLKPILFLSFLTVICGFLARSLIHSETLADLAAAKEDESYQEDSMHINESPEEKKDGENMTTISTEQELNAEASTDIPTVPENNDTQTSPAVPDSRIVYQEGFYYEELTDEVKKRITGISYPVTPAEISYDDLRYLSVLYYDFNGEVQTGELICNKGIVQDFVEIFYELYQNEYQIEKIRLIDEYQGDDTASMADNNTSCFNYRVVDGTSSLSKHALGCAIDINPFYNPYVVFNKNGSGETYISPPGSEIYADRSNDFPYKIDENDLCYKLFKEHGFVWGGDWNSCKDYQHFQKTVN